MLQCAAMTGGTAGCDWIDGASFQRFGNASLVGVLQEDNVRIIMAAQHSKTLSIRRQAE